MTTIPGIEQPDVGRRSDAGGMGVSSDDLAARLEPFDSYWQAPEEVDDGYVKFAAYYRANYLPHLPSDKGASILVISCGPGYLVNVLVQEGYKSVVGIDSDKEKIAHAEKRNLGCLVARAFEYLQNCEDQSFDVIIPEQELAHLTHSETIEFLALCRAKLREGGTLVAYSLNGANPLVGSENLAHNIDHFYTVTEYSFWQLLDLTGYRRIKLHPLKLYVFWKNPLNYVGLAVTASLEFLFRVVFILYGKRVKILSKKIMAVCVR